MEMRGARMLGMCGLVIVALGCGKLSSDHSKVLANVGGEKITEKAFTEAVHLLVGDDAKAKDLMENPAMKDQRNQILAEIVDQKVLLKFGARQGLTKDPKVKFLVEGAMANAYAQILMERSLPKGEPTEAQLKAFYDEVALKAKAEGQDKDFPPYEAVKAQLPAAYKRKLTQEASVRLIKDAKAQVQSTIDPEWRSMGMAQ